MKKYWGKTILTVKKYAIVDSTGKILEKYRTIQSAKNELKKWRWINFKDAKVIKLGVQDETN